MKKVLFGVLSVITLIPSAWAESAGPATSSDTDSSVISIEADTIEVRGVRYNFEVVGGTDGTNHGVYGARGGFDSPTYFAGWSDHEDSFGLLVPIISGARGRIDEKEGEIFRADAKVVGTGLRWSDQVYANDPAEKVDLGYDKDTWDKDFAEKKKELEAKGYKVARSRESCGSYCSDHLYAKARNQDDKPTFTYDVVGAPVSGVVKYNKPLGIEMYGAGIGVANLSAHVAFKISGVPAEVCGEIAAAQWIVGQTNIRDMKNTQVAFMPVEGSACVGIAIEGLGKNRIWIRNEANLAILQATRSYEESNADMTETNSVEHKAQYAQFANTASIERRFGPVRVALTYEFSREQSKGAYEPVGTINTHMFGISVR